ncbi:glycosyltransferase [Modestobacter sp. Leaf380]|uniref:glycosyltransferase n=1 Tax=Modestobacter sp. Leaf380 TaxID=1736356 RepID=UPI0006F38A66|nr:glycosyltransferase [Modestobacter sp. Leaf380]KQS68818.1 hypothetical protein ASG41_07890 [Modestobacter sp. Leaf380]
MVTDSLDTGGLERVVVDVASELSARGHDVTLAAAAGGALWDDVPAAVHRRHPPAGGGLPGRLRRVLWLVRLVRAGRPDVVHAHQRGVALVARAARTGRRTRVVEHVHNVFPARWWTRLPSFRGDHLVACSAAVATMLVRDFGRPAERVTTVLNAVPDVGAARQRVLPVLRAETVPTVLVVARVSAQKDPLRFVAAVGLLNAEGPQVRALWAGEGDLLDEARSAAQALGPDGPVFLGARTDVADLMAGADVVALTSRWEGLPLVLLEAAALGRPLLAPRVGGCPEVVVDGVNGRTFDVDADPAVVAATLSEMLRPDLLAAMGAASRTRYEEHFTTEGRVLAIERVFARVLR